MIFKLLSTDKTVMTLDSIALDGPLETWRHLLILDIRHLSRITGKFLEAMTEGLASRPSTLKMLPSFVSHPVLQDGDNFLGLDLGGTNCRLIAVQLKKDGTFDVAEPKSFKLTPADISGRGEDLFATIAKFIRDSGIIESGKRYQLGFTFAFPVEQTAIDQGRLITWTKGFTASGVVGEEVVTLLRNALQNAGVGNIHVAALVNDTVGTQMTRAYSDPQCVAGLILGTGTNMSVLLDGMIVNMESGGFDPGNFTQVDVQLDAASENPGAQRLEKMVSGKYLGEIVRRVVVHISERTGHFPWLHLSTFKDPYAFPTEWVSLFSRDPNDGSVQNALGSIGAGEVAPEDVQALHEICQMVATRSAQLTAATIAGMALRVDSTLERELVVAVDGSLYDGYPGYHDLIGDGLRAILGERSRNIKLVLTKDGSGIGAAIIGGSVGDG